MQNHSAQFPSDTTGKLFRILSIDGGGVRGLIPLRILEELEKRTGKRIPQLFDLVVGNSTGGIIALGLAAAQDRAKQPKFAARDISKLYLDHSSTIFKKPLLRSFYTGFGLWAPRYNRANLDQILINFFQDTRLSQSVCLVMVTSYDTTKGGLQLWSSYRAKKNGHLNILMSDAAGATSAAPTYFAPKIINHADGSFSSEIDGGIYANDPEEVAVAEALAQDPSLTSDRIFILSLGTGCIHLKKPHHQLRNAGIIGWLLQANLIDIMLNADTELSELETKSFTSLKRHRIQFHLQTQNSAMDCTKPDNLKSLINITENYLQRSGEAIDQLCAFLSASNKAIS